MGEGGPALLVCLRPCGMKVWPWGDGRGEVRIERGGRWEAEGEKGGRGEMESGNLEVRGEKGGRWELRNVEDGREVGGEKQGNVPK